jgi:hypothetical protein
VLNLQSNRDIGGSELRHLSSLLSEIKTENDQPYIIIINGVIQFVSAYNMKYYLAYGNAGYDGIGTLKISRIHGANNHIKYQKKFVNNIIKQVKKTTIPTSGVAIGAMGVRFTPTLDKEVTIDLNVFNNISYFDTI